MLISMLFDFDVWCGEIVVIVGLVGGGKLCFVWMIFGVVWVVVGEMMFDGWLWWLCLLVDVICVGVFLVGEDCWCMLLFFDSVLFVLIVGIIGFLFLVCWFVSGVVC